MCIMNSSRINKLLNGMLESSKIRGINLLAFVEESLTEPTKYYI